MFNAAKNKKEAKDIAFERERWRFKQTIEDLKRENLKLRAEADKYYSLYNSQHEDFITNHGNAFDKQTIEDLKRENLKLRAEIESLHRVIRELGFIKYMGNKEERDK